MNSEVVSRIKTFSSYYGNNDWANSVLRLAIQELQNTERVLSARQLEVFYFLAELEGFGFWWQASRLRNHINLAVKKGLFLQPLEREVDPLGRGGNP